jgi:polyphosphate kinase 2 (PPK2 family)
VLVERVENFCPDNDWMRAYNEINEFEEQLDESGAIVVKFWLAITPAEQLRRFKAREDTPYKRFKITAEDYRNRKRWPQYQRAVNEMVERTSTDRAPWSVIASDDKLYSRVQVIETVVQRLEKAL